MKVIFWNEFVSDVSYLARQRKLLLELLEFEVAVEKIIDKKKLKK